jgi:hypothetical protein
MGWRIITDTATELVANLRKTTGEMQPISLDREPGLVRQRHFVIFGAAG